MRGKVINILLIPNFWESLTIHPPQNKFIAKKWHQNKIKKDLNIEGQLKSEIQSIKDTTDIIDKEVKDIKNIHTKWMLKIS